MQQRQYFMAHTTTPDLNLTISRIKADFTKYKFVLNDSFCWHPEDKEIDHRPLDSIQAIWSLIHELAHANLGHSHYSSDVELVSLEALAWHHAKVLAIKYDIKINNDYIEDNLDTYRDWLHKRSLCPNCDHSGLQNQKTYNCLNCRSIWSANEARICGLKRVLVV